MAILGQFWLLNLLIKKNEIMHLKTNSKTALISSIEISRVYSYQQIFCRFATKIRERGVRCGQ